MTDRLYFDWNATAPLRDEARTAVLGALAVTGNASSVHAEGRTARRLVEDARAQVAALVGAETRNVTFTSGATEANNLALTPALKLLEPPVRAKVFPGLMSRAMWWFRWSALVTVVAGLVTLWALARLGRPGDRRDLDPRTRLR